MNLASNREVWARVVAGLIATGAFVGLVPPLQLSLADGAQPWEAVWHVLRAFTITTNMLVALVFATIAWRGRANVSPLLVGGVMLSILLVGVIFNLVLGQIPQLNWWTWLGDSLHHHVAPVAVPLWWLLFARHGTLTWRAPLYWALYPLTYAGYSLVRAEFEPDSPWRYPYFFMDVDALGWPQVVANLSLIALAFTVVGYAVVWLDRRLAPRA